MYKHFYENFSFYRFLQQFITDVGDCFFSSNNVFDNRDPDQQQINAFQKIRNIK